MEPFAFYLIKSVIWLTGFSLIYLLFLRNERFFRIKRLYLVTGILASFLFPLISFHYNIEISGTQPATAVVLTSTSNDIQAIEATSSGINFNYKYVLLLIYISGMIILAIRMIKHIKALSGIISKNGSFRRGPARIIREPEVKSPFSFFNYIFISPSIGERDAEQILNHEEVHVQQKHWFDLLLAEIVRMLQWANPFAWIYTSFIRQNHEYLADEVALQRTSDPAVYRAVLLNQMFNVPVITLSNSFSYSSGKKRFDMMKKIISSPYRKLKLLFVLPVISIIFYAFATPEYRYTTNTDNTAISAAVSEATGTVKGTVFNEENKPMWGVTITVSGISSGIITNQNGYFAIGKVPEGSSLVFTYSGYKTMTLNPDFSKEMIVIMIKDPDAIPPEYKYVPPVKPTPPKPLVIIDGVESEKGFESIDPNSISTISVLKDQSATAVFGEKGKNGVVVVTLKKEVLLKQTVPDIGQTIVKGIVLKADGTPLVGASIMTSGTMGNAVSTVSGQDGKFEIIVNDPTDVSLMVNCRGYKGQTLKPAFDSEMTIKMETDPTYKAPVQRRDLLVVVDGVVSDKTYEVVSKELGYDLGITKNLSAKAATEKYGEKGQYGVIEIITRPKALAMGLKPPFRRMKPEDVPTFQGAPASSFDNWVISQVKYPAEAVAKGVYGRVYVNLTVELDGSITNIKLVNSPNTVLSEEVLRAVRSSTKWDPPKNPAVDEAYKYDIAIKFKLPDIVSDGKAYVVVEKMPHFPGGDAKLLDFIKDNTHYPDSAKAKNIQGKVIVRFIVNPEGNVEDAMILKGVHPLLDAESVRVVNNLPAFTPGYQGGRAVNVYYMVPITFTLK